MLEERMILEYEKKKGSYSFEIFSPSNDSSLFESCVNCNARYYIHSLTIGANSKRHLSRL